MQALRSPSARAAAPCPRAPSPALDAPDRRGGALARRVGLRMAGLGALLAAAILALAPWPAAEPALALLRLALILGTGALGALCLAAVIPATPARRRGPGTGHRRALR
ncbi:hypothetical protein [Roseivivax sp. CAU 1761]